MFISSHLTRKCLANKMFFVPHVMLTLVFHDHIKCVNSIQSKVKHKLCENTGKPPQTQKKYSNLTKKYICIKNSRKLYFRYVQLQILGKND